MGRNPFDFQNPARPDHFLDRDVERQRLVGYIEEGVNVLVYGPRRRGKTSLITWAFDHASGVVPIYADATRMLHPGDLGDEILAGLTGTGIAKGKRLQKWARDLLAGLELEVGIAKSGAYARVRRGIEPITGLLDALRFLERIGKDSGRRFVVCLDEFQVAMKHDGLVGALRSEIQHQEHVGYVLSGSEPTVLMELNQDKKNPFYEQLVEVRVNGLRIPEMRADAERLLGFPLSTDAVQRIDEVLEDDTKRIIHVLRHIWDSSDGTLDGANAAIHAAMGDEQDRYEGRLERIDSLHYRSVLAALAKDRPAKPLGHEFIQRNDLKTPQHVAKALKALQKAGELDEDNEFQDVLFRYFLSQ